METLIRETLGDLVFGDSGRTLHGVVLDQLRAQNRSLAVVDGAVGGVVSRWLFQADPRGDVFRGGMARSQTVADAAADVAAAQQLFRSDCVLFLGAEFERENDLSREVIIRDGQDDHRFRIRVIRDSTISVEHAAKQGLNLLRKQLQKPG